MFRRCLVLVKESDKWSQLSDKYQMLLKKVNVKSTDQCYILYRIKVKLSKDPNL